MYDIIVVGGGTAGMTAALYALRSNKRVLVLEKENFGGQIANSPRVENYPSIKEISGIEFSENLFDQITSLGAEFELENVLQINKIDNIFEIETDYNKYQSKSVILASGVHHRKLNLPYEEELVGKGISYCAVCDGAFYKNEDVAVIGDGNSALQYALLLSSYCSNVLLATLTEKFYADAALIKKIKEKENIKIIQNVATTSFILNEKNEFIGLNFKNTINNFESKLYVKAAFVAIGQVPQNECFSNLVDLDNQGYIIVNDSLMSKTEGLFVAGDCRVKKIRQLTTAVSDGSVAAINAVAYLDLNNHVD